MPMMLCWVLIQCNRAVLCCCVQEGICMTLKPEFHFLEVAYPYVARWVSGQISWAES
jgi:predicted unusual protein kinase regulating ubiquinone biosynthesis (AarF/ABC1/UbiB family)